jgi:hypothetical protein
MKTAQMSVFSLPTRVESPAELSGKVSHFVANPAEPSGRVFHFVGSLPQLILSDI